MDRQSIVGHDSFMSLQGSMVLYRMTLNRDLVLSCKGGVQTLKFKVLTVTKESKLKLISY